MVVHCCHGCFMVFFDFISCQFGFSISLFSHVLDSSVLFDFISHWVSFSISLLGCVLDTLMEPKPVDSHVVASNLSTWIAFLSSIFSNISWVILSPGTNLKGS